MWRNGRGSTKPGLGILSIRERRPVTSIVVTHDRVEALALGDRLAVLAEGRIRQVGPVHEVFSSVLPEPDHLVAERLARFGAVRRLTGFAREAKEAAQGAALLADGLAGGTYSDLVASLRLREADLPEGEPLLLEAKQGGTSLRIASKPSAAWRAVMFGRTPRVQWEAPWNGGRGHYGSVFSVLVAGGGFKGGHVVGSSTAKGEQVKDLDQGFVRVLHSLSFIDDPTRLLRGVRFEQRFGFNIEIRTLQLMDEARQAPTFEMMRRIRGLADALPVAGRPNADRAGVIAADHLRRIVAEGCFQCDITKRI